MNIQTLERKHSSALIIVKYSDDLPISAKHIVTGIVLYNGTSAHCQTLQIEKKWNEYELQKY